MFNPRSQIFFWKFNSLRFIFLSVIYFEIIFVDGVRWAKIIIIICM